MIFSLNLYSQHCLCKLACSVLKSVSMGRCIENITFNDKYIKATGLAASFKQMESGQVMAVLLNGRPGYGKPAERAAAAGRHPGCMSCCCSPERGETCGGRVVFSVQS